MAQLANIVVTEEYSCTMYQRISHTNIDAHTRTHVERTGNVGAYDVGTND